MKKILFIAILSIFASATFAQGLGLGARISYQSEGMVGDNAEYFSDENVSDGYAVGVDLLYHFNERLALRTGLDFMTHIYSWTEGSGKNELDNGYLLMYLNAPVLARFNFTRGFFAEAGLDLNFNVVSKVYHEDPIGDDLNWDDLDKWNAFQLGLSAGFGYTMWFGLEFSCRTTYGLLEPVEKADYRPLRFQIDISYWFLK